MKQLPLVVALDARVEAGVDRAGRGIDRSEMGVAGGRRATAQRREVAGDVDARPARRERQALDAVCGLGLPVRIERRRRARHLRRVPARLARDLAELPADVERLPVRRERDRLAAGVVGADRIGRGVAGRLRVPGEHRAGRRVAGGEEDPLDLLRVADRRAGGADVGETSREVGDAVEEENVLDLTVRETGGRGRVRGQGGDGGGRAGERPGYDERRSSPHRPPSASASSSSRRSHSAIFVSTSADSRFCSASSF